MENNVECITDQAEINAYLDIDEWGYYQTLLYYNQEFFDAEQYGE